MLDNGLCVFCDIIRNGGYEGAYGYNFDERVVRFTPLNPVVLGHKLFVNALHTTDASESPNIAGMVFKAAAQYAQDIAKPYNLITSGGKEATQTVSHFHVHYVPRRQNDGLMLPWTGQQPLWQHEIIWD